MKTTPFARSLGKPANLAALWIVIAAHSLSTLAPAESAGVGAGSPTPAAEAAPDVRQSWEDDYASLKAALSKRDNRYGHVQEAWASSVLRDGGLYVMSGLKTGQVTVRHLLEDSRFENGPHQGQRILEVSKVVRSFDLSYGST